MRDDLLPEFFTVETARALGLSRRQRDAAIFERPFHGIRSTHPADPDSVGREERVRRRAGQYATAMPAGSFFSHLTAAVLWGLPLPPALITAELDVAVWAPRRSPRGQGVAGHQLGRSLARGVQHPTLGVPLTSPASTWALLGAVLLHPYDLVAAGDAVVRTPQHRDDPPALATLEQLAAAVDAGRRVGRPALRGALPRVRVGASSRPETWLRLTLVDAGLPEPALAYEVRDRRGLLIGRLDLAYPLWRIAIEYEGGQHLTDRDQWTKDIRRYEGLAAEGWTVIRATRDDLFAAPQELVARVRAVAAGA